MTRHQMLAQLKTKFKDLEDPVTEARALMRQALEIDFNDLILNDLELPEAQAALIDHWSEERLKGTPLAYLAGKKHFHKYEFLVKPGVLIPRPETELLVFVGAKRLPQGSRVRIADLGCGSGCVGLTLLKEISNAELYAVDTSPVACLLTEENAEQLGVRGRTHVLQSDAAIWRPDVQFELIVANPPYIPIGDRSVEQSVDQFEPHEALYSGPDGLDAIRSWITWAPGQLRLNGVMALEIGAGQSARVQEIMREAGFQDLQVLKDFAGIDRIISGKRGTLHG